MSNVEQPQASTARRRRPAVSNGDQWHEVQEQLLQAFDALAVSISASRHAISIGMCHLI